MLQNVPLYISIGFILTTFIAVYLFYRAAHQSNYTLTLLIMWLAVQTIASLSGFYAHIEKSPPRFMLATLPALAFIIGLFVSKAGRKYIDQLNLKTLTYLHTIRIPVELILLGLYYYGQVPRLMTLEGRNFDILAGISAPIIAYFCFRKHPFPRPLLLGWNIISFLLLLNIVINAVLSAPFPFQKWGFEQPNVAILYFPFIWLPCCVVPLVLLSHLVAFRRLAKKRKNYQHAGI